MLNLKAGTAPGAAVMCALLAAALIAGTVACTAESHQESAKRHSATPPEGQDAHAHGPHDGVVEPIGSVGHVEFLHDADAGRVDLYFLAADKKTPAKPDAAPALNLKTEAGPKQVAFEPADGEGHFRAVDEALKGAHPSGQVVVKMGGKDHIVMLAHHHHDDAADQHQEDDGHDHDGEGHPKGNEHGDGEPAHK